MVQEPHMQETATGNAKGHQLGIHFQFHLILFYGK
jgi:hypothetical protein